MMSLLDALRAALKGLPPESSAQATADVPHAMRRTRYVVQRRYQRVLDQVPKLLPVLTNAATPPKAHEGVDDMLRRLGNAWALAPVASRATRATVDDVLERGSTSTSRICDLLSGENSSRVAALAAIPPSPRRGVLDRAFARGTNLAAAAAAEVDIPGGA